MSNPLGIPPGVIVFGPDATCTLDTCPVEWSILTYQPSIPVNGVLMALFAVAGVVHAYLGFRWRSWGFMGGMLVGCIAEIIGYVGRLLLHDNPFSWNGFMIQISESPPPSALPWIPALAVLGCVWGRRKVWHADVRD